MTPTIKTFLLSLFALAVFYYIITPQPSAITRVNFDLSDSLVEMQQAVKSKTGLLFEHEADLLKAYQLTQWLETPYQFAGTSKAGSDCSGFVYAFYEQNNGILLHRSSKEMINNVDVVAPEKAHLGDIVFFARNGDEIFHVGIYLADRKFIHASTKKGVVISSLNDYFYKKHFFAVGKAKK